MKIINIGSLNYDRVYGVDHFVQAGETILADGYGEFLGGKGLNQSTALARAGAEVYHAGAIGPDGEALKNFLTENGVHTELLKSIPTVSGHAIIQNAKGANCIIVFGGANQCITEADIDEFLQIGRAGDLLLLQNETSCVPQAMRKAKEKGMKIAFNASPINAKLLTYPLDLVDIFLVNEVEGKVLAGNDSAESEKGPESERVTGFEKILGLLHDKYPKAEIVLTIGEKGVLYQCGDIRLSHGTYPTVITDTTAAGDTFTGYFLAERCKGSDAATALYYASLASGYSISKAGAAPSIPTREELQEYARHWGQVQMS